MDIQEIRRANLKAWVEQNGVPAAEKSYFSQVLGGASFGERAARRIETTYRMAPGYLDDASDKDVHQAANDMYNEAKGEAALLSIIDAWRHGDEIDRQMLKDLADTINTRALLRNQRLSNQS